MFFAVEDYQKIQTWLIQNAVKDSDFEELGTLTGEEIMPLYYKWHNYSITTSVFRDYLRDTYFDELSVTTDYDALLEIAYTLVVEWYELYYELTTIAAAFIYVEDITFDSTGWTFKKSDGTENIWDFSESLDYWYIEHAYTGVDAIDINAEDRVISLTISDNDEGYLYQNSDGLGVDVATYLDDVEESLNTLIEGYE